MKELWLKQIGAVVRLELQKTFFARRGLWIYLLALAPVGLFTLHTLVELHFRGMGRSTATLGQDTYVFAGVFQFFFLRLAIFFGCLGIFMNLFRGEMLDKSLHFYLLAPVRREVLLVGKYLAGLLAATVIFTSSTALQLAALLSRFDSATISHFFNQSHGVSQILAYLGRHGSRLHRLRQCFPRRRTPVQKSYLSRRFRAGLGSRESCIAVRFEEASASSTTSNHYAPLTSRSIRACRPSLHSSHRTQNRSLPILQSSG